MSFPSLAATALSIFCFIAIGFFLRKTKLIGESFASVLSPFVAKVAQPFLIVYSFVRLEYSREALLGGLIIFGCSVAAHLFLALCAHFVFLGVRDPGTRKIDEFACTFSNCAFVGFPILESLFGDIGLFYGAFYVIAHNIGIWSYGVLLLTREKGTRISLRKIFLNIGTVTCAAGLVLYLSRISVPDALLTVLDSMAGLCTPLSLIVTGALVAAMPLKALFSNPRIYDYCAVKLLALPLLAAVILRFVMPSSLMGGILSMFLVIMIAMPPASFTTLFAEMYDRKPVYAAQLVSLGTIFYPFTTLAVAALAKVIL